MSQKSVKKVREVGSDQLRVLSPKPAREYADPHTSERGGFAGFFEGFLRRFKNLTHLVLILPMYLIGCLALGTAAAPAIALYELLSPQIFGLQNAPLRWVAIGSLFAACYFTYGFSLLIVVPTLNFILRAKLKAWRGAYYSLEAIRWYIHNGVTYLARYTFLDFVTPTPFSILFYRLMGMKIGDGVALNTTNISDPCLIEMGEKVTIGGSVTIVGHYGQGGYLVLAPVKIGDKVTIGLKATILGGVIIGEKAKVLPNSVVMPKTVIPPGETWGGVPAKKLDL